MRHVLIFFMALLVGFIPASSNAQSAMANAPAFGNPSGDVTIVEFYDYRCSYCKASEDGLERVLQEDRNLKIVYMDFPKLGPLSDTAAIATLASMRQGAGKYITLHYMLMNKNMNLSSEEKLYDAASAAGIDVNQLQTDMADPAITQQIENNIEYGRSIGVKVTPDFVIGGKFYPGYASYDELKERIAWARQH